METGKREGIKRGNATSVLSVAIAETLGELPAGQDVPDQGNEVVVASGESEQAVASDVERQIDDIVNELMLDEELRDALNGENEDEGIGINVFDEIEFDIEPFDYELEVE